MKYERRKGGYDKIYDDKIWRIISCTLPTNTIELLQSLLSFMFLHHHYFLPLQATQGDRCIYYTSEEFLSYIKLLWIIELFITFPGKMNY